MFTMFHGFPLVEEYHQWKKQHRSNRNPIGVKAIKLFFAIAIPLFFWIAPSSLYGLPGLTPVEHRVLAIFVFAALMWLFDAVPAWTTSVTAVFSMFISNTATATMMLTSGLIMGCIGLLLGYIVLIFCGSHGIF